MASIHGDRSRQISRFFSLIPGVILILLSLLRLPMAAHSQSVSRINPPHLTIRGAALAGTIDHANDTGMMVGDSGLVMRYLGFSASRYQQLDAKISKSVTLYAVAFTNQLRAAIGGSNGALAYTTNCGASWSPSSIGTSATIRNMTATVNGILIGVGDSGLIIRSTNSGKNWTRLSSPTSAQLNAVSFGTADTGFAVGNDTVILRTADAGNTWQTIPFPYDLKRYDTLVRQIDFSSVYAQQGDVLWVGVRSPVMPLLMMRDSATDKWRVGTPNLPIFPHSGPLTSLVSVGDGLASLYGKPINTLMGLAADDYLYAWGDSATGWTRRIISAFGDADGNTDPAPMRNYCAALAPSTNGNVLTFGGDELQSWEGSSFDGYGAITQNLYPNGREPINFLSVSIAPDGYGYAAGTGAARDRTTDGGISWRPVTNILVDQKLNSICTLTDAIAIASGWNGLILRTTDAGKNWDSIGSGTTNKLHGIAFPTVDVGIIVGDFGYIIRSTDTGRIWANVPVPGSIQDFLWTVAFADGQIGVACGDGGRILRTIDAGQHWSDVNNVLSGTPASIRQVEAFPDGTFIARAGTNLIRSTDFGANWQFVPLPTSDSLGMSFFNRKIGIVAERSSSSAIVPDTAFLAFTTDGGQHWKHFAVNIWNYDRILFHWLNDHQVLLYGIQGFVVMVNISTSDVRITRKDIGPSNPVSIYPNPSAGTVRVDYVIGTGGLVTIDLWDETGKSQRQLFVGEEFSGVHSRSLSIPTDLHGTFVLRVSQGETSAATKLILR